MSWEKEMWLMWQTLSKRNPRAHLVLVLGCSKARATMLCSASSVGCSVRLRPLRLLTVSMAGSHGRDPLFEVRMIGSLWASLIYCYLVVWLCGIGGFPDFTSWYLQTINSQLGKYQKIKPIHLCSRNLQHLLVWARKPCVSVRAFYLYTLSTDLRLKTSVKTETGRPRAPE